MNPANFLLKNNILSHKKLFFANEKGGRISLIFRNPSFISMILHTFAASLKTHNEYSDRKTY